MQCFNSKSRLKVRAAVMTNIRLKMSVPEWIPYWM